jgi:hypothetical protein
MYIGEVAFFETILRTPNLGCRWRGGSTIEEKCPDSLCGAEVFLKNTKILRICNCYFITPGVTVGGKMPKTPFAGPIPAAPFTGVF